MTKPLVRKIETSTGGHYYLNSNDEKIPGVTSVADILPKGGLQTWKIKKAVSLALAGEIAWADKPDNFPLMDWLATAGEREADKAAKIGTKAHEFAEFHMLGHEPSIESLNKRERKHAECFLHFVRDWDPQPILIEKILTHLDPKTGIPIYCGTMDLCARLTDGFTWLVDYKASTRQARPSHALQAAAYRYATHWVDEETGELHPMPEIHRAAVILLNGGSEDKCYRMYELDTSPIVFSVFKSLLRIYNFDRIKERTILGEM